MSIRFQQYNRYLNPGRIYSDEEFELLPEFEIPLNESREYAFYPGKMKEQYGQSEYETGVVAANPKTISLYNTDLNAPYFGGNFSFLYNGGASEAVITLNTYLSYRKKYSDKEKRDFISNLQSAIDVWDNAAEIQIQDNAGNYSSKIKLRFKLNFVTNPKNANKVTDVHPNNTWSSWFNGKNREIIMREINVFIGTSRNTFVHELGHVWGLLDEYDTKWIEKKFSPGHIGTNSPLLKDTKSIMNIGYQDERFNSGEFRTRYFTHFGKALLPAFWGLPNYVQPVKHNGRVISKTIQGRIALLKKDIAGSPAETTDNPPFNPKFTKINITKR